jgi:hypothetical protein
MIRLTADDTCLLKELRLFIEPVEVYDPAGRLLGLFVPANLERGKQLYAKAAANLDRAEIKRRLESKEPGVTHEEIWGRIRQLEAELKSREAAGQPPFTQEESLAFLRELGGQRQANGSVASLLGSVQESPRCPTP